MTDENIANLRLWWLEDVPTAEIGRRFGVSKSAIIGKAHRLGLITKQSPLVAGGALRKPERLRFPSESPRLPGWQEPVRHTLPPIPPPPEMPAHSVEALPPVFILPPPPPKPVLKTLTAGGCCWLSGNLRPYIACDRPTVGRQPYCEEHARRAYVAVRRPLEVDV